MNITFGELKLRARRSLYGNMGTLAGILILFGVCSVMAILLIYLLLVMVIICSKLFGSFFPSTTSILILILTMFLLFCIVMAAVLNVLQMGFYRIMLDIANARPAVFERIWFPFKNSLSKFFGVTAVLFGIGSITAFPVVLYDQISPAGNLYDGGRILLSLIQNGFLLWLCASFSQTFLLLLEDPKKTVFECLAGSYEMMKGHRLRYLLLQISFLGWYLLGCLSFGIGFVIIFPYTACTSVHFYLDLSERRRLDREASARRELCEDSQDEEKETEETEEIEKTEEMKIEAWDNQ